MATDIPAEPVRLVIWDLDETFWSGTLTEGGITYRRDFHDIVLELARRGIVSSICSKNDIGAVREVLEREGIWDSFVFPSINWESKGPRLAALVEAVQLRAPTIMFIDDNAMNRAEARHFVPGIQVQDETFIPAMLDSPLFRGKDDSGLSRLKQYRLLERRQTDERASGGDTTDFLRGSNIRISIEHDLEPHIDRAIEMINRTNQLNFTKRRLPEDIDAARTELRALLSAYSVQAGIIKVRDNYGDYGYCGLYVMHSGAAGTRLAHFCFSCRILNMGVETWLYQHLGRPALKIAGEVLSNPVRDTRIVDWITVELPQAQAGEAGQDGALDYVYARGGCDLHAVTHYFNMAAREVHREFNTTRNGANMRFDHSMFVRYALRGIPQAARAAFAALGYQDADYATVVGDLPAQSRGVWVLSFWADADFALYRHRATGEAVPVSLPALQTNHRNMMRVPLESVSDAATAAMLRILHADFEYAGMIAEADFKENARLLLSHAPADTPIFIIMASEAAREVDGNRVIPHKKRQLNGWIRDVAAAYPNVALIDIAAFVQVKTEVTAENHNHFDRMVYFRVFQHIMRETSKAVGQAAAA